MNYSVKKLEKSQIEVGFELSVEEFEEYIQKALLHLKEHVKIDGFRKGNVPKEMVEKEVGQENLLMEAGDLAVKKSYAKFVTENKLEPIGEPEVQIVKIAKGNPLLFKVKVSVLPDIELPNYKKIASQVKSSNILVDQKEIEEALRYLQKSRAKFSQEDRPAEAKDFVEIEYQNKDINGGKEIKDKFILGEGGFLKDFEDNIIGMKAGQEKEFISKFPENTPNKNLAGKDSNFKVKMISVQKMELPEINDEFAKALGVFDGLVSLKENLKEGITMEKNEEERQRKRGEMVSKITEKVKFDLPEKMVEYEQARLFEDLKNQIAKNFKMPFEDYLSSIKKTEEEIKASFTLEAEKRIKNFLVLRQIGKVENIEVSEKELEEEMNKVLKKYSMPTGRQAKDQLEKIDINELKDYNKGAIFNEKVFQFLENASQIN
ncbi:MAG: Trigger factor [Parcubacteria group bacterium GW2011_GWA1_33_6]|uniref:Trigger factor n=1 Tax=Candidatus Staskawiczbacteria bacterium RIFCSPHIGHO2_02_FULL_33_16 TaxID=1802204 RepID=A0A1G2HWK2_9BACT|nr:MAG: Trigger factor [Parcubacteria group bacterium GW2011_GWA1_33_6]OGZ66789.1 MAG: trigger factor [Candidatus Staskawiczbacteria bacterium RIFCSPHIGHO2_02_FULL_33_16]OGZ70897.1 MAG: trigger factor [Candidatus Staskawiczbacteria bacterium RIFCSPLOWO2_01_FULL_33_13]